MKNTRAYLRHQIKTNLRTFLYISAISLLFTFVIGFNTSPKDYYLVKSESEGALYMASYSSTLYLPVIVLCVLCYLIPML